MPLPQQMPDIRIKLSEDQAKTIGLELLEKIRQSRSGMRKLLDNIKQYEAFYESDLPEKNHPWEGCSNINVPIIQPDADTFHAHINGTVLGVIPTTKVVPPPFASDPEVKKSAQRVESAIEHVERNIMDYPQSADQWHLTAIMHPAGVAKLAWREEFNKVTRIVPELDQETQQMVPKPVQMDEIKYRGPKLEMVDLTNFVIFPLTSKSIDEAYLVGDRFNLTPDDVRKRVERGYFDKIAETLKPTSELSSTDEFEQQERNDRAGIENVDFEHFKFWEVIAPYDPDGDGVNEDCVFVIEADTGVVVRATKFPYFHGRRYYIALRPWLKASKAFFGRCLPQILEHSQREANTVHNQRVDATAIATAKAFKTRKGALDNPDAIEICPGAMIELNDITDIMEFDINPLVPGVDIEQENRANSERASGVNDIATGRQSSGDKTLGELQMVSARAGVRFEDVIRRVQYGHCEVARQIAGLMYQFMDDGELAMIGNGLTREELVVPWDYVGHGNTGTADKQQEAQKAALIYQKMIEQQNPLVMNDLRRIYRVTLGFLQSLDINDPESYIGTEQQVEEQIMMMQAQQKMVMEHQQMMMTEQAERQGMQQQQQQQMELAKMDMQARENQATRDNQLAIAKTRRQSAKPANKR
jgi:hypothetical protein